MLNKTVHAILHFLSFFTDVEEDVTYQEAIGEIKNLIYFHFEKILIGLFLIVIFIYLAIAFYEKRDKG